MRNTLYEDEPRIDSKVAAKRRSRLYYRRCWIEGNKLVEQATIEIDSLCEGINHSCSLSRARVEELCMGYLRDGAEARRFVLQTSPTRPRLKPRTFR